MTSTENRVAPWTTDFPPAASVDDIRDCFRLLLGRWPSPEEWTGHSALAGAPLAHVVAGYVNSLEFQNRHLIRGELGAQRFRQLDGFRLLVSTEDLHIGKPIFETGVYEPNVTKVFRDNVRPGSTVVDVGANVGFFTFLSASLVGATGAVHAFEPGPQNVRSLVASRAENAFSNVHVYPVAASDAIGVLRFANTFSNGFVTPELSGEANDLLASTFVMGIPIDLVLPETDVRLIKIDTEGFENRVLAGARRTIARCRPLIVSEFSPPALLGGSGVRGEQYLEALLEPGYRLRVLHKNGAVEDCGNEPAKVMAAFERSGIDHVDLLAVPAEIAGRSPEESM